MTLSELYRLKIMEYKLYGKKEKPDKLLAMLMLPEKDCYNQVGVTGKFYQKYREPINKKIAQVERDFDFKPEEYVQIIEEKNIYIENLDEDKIWFVFCEGFAVVDWGIMYHNDETAEEIYTRMFGDELLWNCTKKRYQFLSQEYAHSLEEFPYREKRKIKKAK